MTLGEIGKLSDLGALGEVYTTVLHFFSDASEEVKSASAFALGNLAVGNLNKFMPMILQEIKQQPKKQYLLLHSLKEVISQESQKDGAKNLIPFAEEVWQILFNNCESEEEGTRSAVAECLGKLTMINPQKYLPSLQVSSPFSHFFPQIISTVFIFPAKPWLYLRIHSGHRGHCHQVHICDHLARVQRPLQIPPRVRGAPHQGL